MLPFVLRAFALPLFWRVVWPKV